MEYIIFLIMKQKTRFNNFGNIRYWLLVHKWRIDWYWPQKSHISRSLLKRCGKPSRLQRKKIGNFLILGILWVT